MEAILYSSFVNLTKFKVSLLNGETNEVEDDNLVGCYTTLLKDGISNLIVFINLTWFVI